MTRKDRPRHTVADWLQDDVFRRLMLNSGKLLTANALAAILGIVVSVLAARELGPDGYGTLALVLVFKETVGKLVGFNGWQAIIKFGTEALEEADFAGFRQLVKFGFGLDLGSAAVGLLLALFLAEPVAQWLGWSSSIHPLLVFYSYAILFSLTGTPVGILRLFDRFDLLGYVAIVNVLVKILGVLWCIIAGLGLYGYVRAYFIAEVMSHFFQVGASLWVLRRNGGKGFLQQPFHGLRGRFPGIWDYVWTTNFNSTIRLLSREADELIIAAFTTPSALGLFKIAKQFTRVLGMLSDPFYQSIYPELSRLWAARDRKSFFAIFKRASILASAVALISWLGFVLLGRWAITLILGVEYQAAYAIAVVYMLALCVALGTVAFQPSMLAMGLPKVSFKVLLAATLLYFVVLIPFVGRLGVLGASFAYVVFYVSWSLLMAIFLLRNFQLDY